TNASEIVGLALVAGLATGFFRPAVYAGVPNMVSESELPAANALLQTVENVSWAAGPVLGGVLTAAEGPHLAYWINAVSFAVSAVLVLRIPARLLQSETMLSRGHWRDLRDGFSAVLHSRSLLAVLVAWTIALAGSGATSVAEVFMAKNTLHAGDFGYGLLYAASVDIWMAAGCCLVGGIGNGAAVVCNALLVQRTRDDLRGRALTFVMSAT